MTCRLCAGSGMYSLRDLDQCIYLEMPCPNCMINLSNHVAGVRYRYKRSTTEPTKASTDAIWDALRKSATGG